MTDKKKTGQSRLSREILGMVGVSALIALLLFLILSGIATVVAENYCFQYDIPMTEFDWIEVDRWIFGTSAIVSICAFTIMFLCLLNDRVAYIGKITRGVEALRAGRDGEEVPLEGKNELTELARAINTMSAARKQLREREQALAQEKDALIRTLSHDIRTPLTSILAYSEYLASRKEISPEEQKEYLQLIGRKGEQIRALTEILLDGSKRNPEQFEHAELLLAQIVEEFESELEDRFTVQTDLTGCPAFSGTFDVQELRRIFDNLSSNVGKYADPDQPVKLSVRMEGGRLMIRQCNAVGLRDTASEGHGIGLNSIRRIVQHYAGRVTVERESGRFVIDITLFEF